MSLNSAAWMAFEGEVWELSELDGYETPIKDGYLNDVVSGDLNMTAAKTWSFWKPQKTSSISSPRAAASTGAGQSLAGV